MNIAKHIIKTGLNFRLDSQCKHKLRLITKHLGEQLRVCPRPIKDKYAALWRKIEKNPDSTYVSIYSSINGIISENYLPENTYYKVVEPTLNNRAFALAYSDKNVYEKLLSKHQSLLPRTYLRGVEGVNYDEFFSPILDETDLLEEIPDNRELVIKPGSDSAGGALVARLELTRNGNIAFGEDVVERDQFLNELRIRYHGNYIIQEKVVQHPWYARFNTTSVNTVRMMTYRSVKNESITILGSVLRFGQEGSFVDNQAAGGLSCGISDTGTINTFNIDKFGSRRSFSEEILGDTNIPLHSEMKSIASQLAAEYPYHRLLGFDFCLNEGSDVKLLEINVKNLEINFLQMNLGPLFREYTEEVIKYCSIRKRTIVLDFQI